MKKVFNDLLDGTYATPDHFIISLQNWLKKWSKVVPEYSLTMPGFLLKVCCLYFVLSSLLH